MLEHSLDLLRFLGEGCLWTVLIVCLLRFCKRIEPAAVIRLVAPVLFILGIIAAAELLPLLIQLKDAAVHRSWSQLHLLPQGRSRGDGAAWLSFAARLAPLAFFVPAVRKNFCAITAIVTLAWATQHYHVLAAIFR